MTRTCAALVVAVLLIAGSARAGEGAGGLAILKGDAFRHYVDEFNAADTEDVINAVPR